MPQNTNNPEIVAKIQFDTSDAPQTIGNLRQEFTAARKEIYETTKGTDAYFIALKKAADLKGQMTELNRVIKLLNPEEKLRAIQGIAEGAVGAFTAVRGASALFGEKNEEVIKTIEKLEAAMALLRGLKAFNEGIRDAKALIGVMGIARKAAKAQAAATAEIGAAQEANAVSTKVATAATNGFGFALKALGIGLLIAGIAWVVDNFKALKQEFKDLLPNMDGVGDSFNKFKQIAVGVGGAVINVVLTPVKLLISGIGTMIKVFEDLKGGHFADAFTDIGKGVQAGVQIVKDGFNVVKNFKDGEASSAAAQADDRRKEELKKEIENNEDKIALLKEQGKETFKLELETLNKKKELYKDDEKETKRNNLEIEKLLIQHHKKLAEIEKERERKIAEQEKKEDEEDARIQKEHLKRQAETAEKDREERLIAQEKLLTDSETFIEKGDELDKQQAQRKLDKLKKEFEDLKARGGDIISLEASYNKQRLLLEKDLNAEKLAEQDKANKKFLDIYRNASARNLLDQKKTYADRLKLEDAAYSAAIASTTLTESEKTAIEREHSQARKEIEKLEIDAKRANFKAVEGILNSAGEALGKNTAAGKTAAIAAATISTYQAAQAAFASQLLPGDPTSPARGAIAAAGAVVAGLAKVKAIIATKTPGGGVGSQSNPVFTAPVSGDFSAPAIQQNRPVTNISQDSLNQINSNQNQQPSQITVSESDISSTQARVASYQSAGQIG